MHSTYYEIRQQSQLRWEDPKAKKVFMKARKAFKKLENATEDHKGLSESYIVAIQAGQIISSRRRKHEFWGLQKGSVLVPRNPQLFLGKSGIGEGEIL